jgi:hypothetical protein
MSSPCFLQCMASRFVSLLTDKSSLAGSHPAGKLSLAVLGLNAGSWQLTQDSRLQPCVPAAPPF